MAKRQGERRPKRSDFASDGRYYTAMLMWLDGPFPDYHDRVERARTWYEIERKSTVPVQRKVKLAVESAQSRAIREELDLALERIGEGASAIEAERSRIVALVLLERKFTAVERREYQRLVERRHARKRQSREIEAVFAKAHERWARRSNDRKWIAKWEERAKLEPSGITAEGLHFVSYLVKADEKARREAKRARAAVKHARHELADVAPSANEPAATVLESVPVGAAAAGATKRAPRAPQVHTGDLFDFDGESADDDDDY